MTEPGQPGPNGKVTSDSGAEGESGESGKYEKAAQTMENRWLLFTAVAGYSPAQEPTLEMAEEFGVFMFNTRQYRSREDKVGLGDSASLLARYTLAQKVFPKLGHASWQDLSAAKMRELAKPFSDTLAETWQRLRRALPERKSSSTPFVKAKWSEVAVFQAQDAVYENMDAKAEPLNVGLTRLAIMALVRNTCQRPTRDP